MSSIVRKLYYHRRFTPFPRVAAGLPDSWDPGAAISSTGYPSAVWSPCSRFVARRTKEAAEVRDPSTFELLSTLQPTGPTSQLAGTLAYSPDGRSLACVSNTAIIIWDLLTCGIVGEHGTHGNGPSVWSLDGTLISTIVRGQPSNTLTMHMYDVSSHTVRPLSPFTLQSQNTPHLWAHSQSFRAMTIARDDKAYTINTSRSGPL